MHRSRHPSRQRPRARVRIDGKAHGDTYLLSICLVHPHKSLWTPINCPRPVHSVMPRLRTEHIIPCQHGETHTGAETRASTNNKCLLVFYLDTYHHPANTIVSPLPTLSSPEVCQALPMAHGKAHIPLPARRLYGGITSQKGRRPSFALGCGALTPASSARARTHVCLCIISSDFSMGLAITACYQLGSHHRRRLMGDWRAIIRPRGQSSAHARDSTHTYVFHVSEQTRARCTEWCDTGISITTRIEGSRFARTLTTTTHSTSYIHSTPGPGASEPVHHIPPCPQAY